MRKISTIFLIVAAFQVSAQSYRPFPDSDHFWNEEHQWLMPGGSCGDEYHSCQDPIYFSNDTTINATVYHVLKYRQSCQWIHVPGPPQWPCQAGGSYGIGEFLYAIIRQDVLLKKVFIYDVSSGNEMLLYDFNLAVGDTLPPAYNNPGYPNVYVVRMDSLLLADGYHNRYVLNVPSFTGDSAALVEGIGSTFGLLAPLFTPFENLDRLVCFADTVQTIYPNATTSCQLSLGLPPVAIEPFEVYPNPFKEKISLRPGLPGDGHVEIFSSDGRLLLSGDVPAIGVDLDVASWPGGLYFLRYTGQVNTVQKLVKY